jgi:hypothetical protein
MDAALCKECAQIKPIASFKYLLSRAQTRARGGLGLSRMEVVMEKCDVCRAKKPRRSPSELTRTELTRKVINGDVRHAVAEKILATRDRNKTKTRTAAANKRWKAAVLSDWDDAMQDAVDEAKRVRERAKAVKRTLKAGPLDLRVAQLSLEYHELLSSVLRAVRSRARMLRKMGKRIPAVPVFVEDIYKTYNERRVPLWKGFVRPGELDALVKALAAWAEAAEKARARAQSEAVRARATEEELSLARGLARVGPREVTVRSWEPVGWALQDTRVAPPTPPAKATIISGPDDWTESL